MENKKKSEKNKDKKAEFKKRQYNFIVKLLKFVDRLSFDRITAVIIDQIVRSGISIIMWKRKAHLPEKNLPIISIF